MDIFISLVLLTPQQLKRYKQQFASSNLPKPFQYELFDLLETALEQTQQAKSMGWIDEADLINRI